jgi:hypothetical protein
MTVDQRKKYCRSRDKELSFQNQILFLRGFLSMKKTVLFLSLLLLCVFSVIGQAPRPSQKASIMQTVGDATVSITYHRPLVNGRKIWGDLVPYGQVWRAGANDATLFETSVDVTINGQKLPAGKYALYTIPTTGDWTLIFNKKFDQWGTDYDKNKAEDALKVTGIKASAGEMIEALNYEFENVTPTAAKVVLKWEKLRVPFTVDVGDVSARVLGRLRDAAAAAKPDNFNAPASFTSYVLNSKLTANYAEAMTMVDKSISISERFGNLRLKSLLAAEMGNTKDAIATGEKALTVGKAATPPANAQQMADLEKSIAAWKAKK